MSAVLHLVILMVGILATRHWADQTAMPVKPLQAYLVYDQPRQEIKPDRAADRQNPPPPSQSKPAVLHAKPTKPTPPAKPHVTQLTQPDKPIPSTPEVRKPAEVPPLATPEAAKPATQNPSVLTKPVANTAPKVNAQYAASNPKPLYPAIAKRLGQQGTVELRVLVSEQGSATRVEVAQSSGYGNLDAAAVEAISKWKFEPATQNGKPVSQWLTTKWTYELQN